MTFVQSYIDREKQVSAHLQQREILQIRLHHFHFVAGLRNIQNVFRND